MNNGIESKIDISIYVENDIDIDIENEINIGIDTDIGRHEFSFLTFFNTPQTLNSFLTMNCDQDSIFNSCGVLQITSLCP